MHQGGRVDCWIPAFADTQRMRPGYVYSRAAGHAHVLRGCPAVQEEPQARQAAEDGSDEIGVYRPPSVEP